MEPVTITSLVVTAAVAAIGKSIRSLTKNFSKRLVGNAIKIEIKTKDGRELKIEGNISDPEEIEKLIEALNTLNTETSENFSASEGE